MEIITSNSYKGLPINTDESRGLGCISSVLDKYIDMLSYMISAHSKVMQIRFDLHYPLDANIVPDRRHIYYFRNNLIRMLDRQKGSGGHRADPQLTWTEEQGDGGHPHYHFVLLVNGNLFMNYIHLLQNFILPVWQRVLNSNNAGIVDFCNKLGPNGMLIDRNSQLLKQQIEACTFQASYIAKARSKENKLKGTWLTGGTRIPTTENPALFLLF